jgi:pyruvate dehydrogenase complex dehydrogenase (E1) component
LSITPQVKRFDVFDSKEALEYHIFQRAGASNDDLNIIRSGIIAVAVQRAAMLLHKSTCSSAGIVAGTSFDMSHYTLVPQNCP